MKKQWATAKRLLAGAMCLALFQVNAFAAEEMQQNRSITYEQAYEMALKHNSTLSGLVDKLENVQDNRKDFSDGTLVPNSDGKFITMDAVRLGYLSRLRGLDNSITATRLEQDITKVGVGASVKSYFAQIQTLQKALELEKESYKIQRQLLIQANVKEGLGIISKNDLEEAKRAVETAEQSIKKTELSLENAYVALNDLLGFKAEERYIIDHTITFEPMKLNSSIDMYINQKVTSDEALKIQKLAIDSAKFAKEVVVDTTSAADYRNAEYSYEESERSYKDAKLKKEQTIRSTYNKLLELEAERVTLEKALEKAEQDFATAEINLKVGNITQLQLEQAKLALESAEMNLLSNALTHDVTKYSFEHTCILS